MLRFYYIIYLLYTLNTHKDTDLFIQVNLGYFWLLSNRQESMVLESMS